ncbi:pilus assembly FimT family protein [Photobacterium nomapromontoriensis]|uniref:pilus assembly FimT family protein n=1 Tax=Photobacterium nomapromontoriensis TaxID=2910237 RepID=UPI003D0BBE90
MKNQGFTLLELMIAISILTIMIAMAAPGFHNIFNTNTINLTTTELRGLLVAAKSEAVMRSKDVYLHTIGLTPTATLTNNWCVIASTDPSATTCTPNSNTLYLIKGSNLKGLNIKRHSSYASLKIDKLQGHPDFQHGETNVDWLTFEKESGKAITMQMNLFGRLYRCGVGGKWYGADACE